MEAVMDLGLDLNGDDYSELTFKYRCPMDAPSMAVDYAPFLRFLVEIDGPLTPNGRRHSHHIHDGEESDDDDSYFPGRLSKHPHAKR